MAESIRISQLDELVSGSVLGTTKVPVVDGGATKYTQASSLKAYVNSDVATDAELSAQISAVNSTIDGLTTADISENASYLYYTDTRVTNRLNELEVISGSGTALTITDGGDNTITPVDTITFSNATVSNGGSGNVNVEIPSLTVGVGVTNVNNVDTIIFEGDGVSINNDLNGNITIIISDTQTDIDSLNTFTSSANGTFDSIDVHILNIATFTASFSESIQSRITPLEEEIVSLLSVNIVSSSQQIDYLNITNLPEVFELPLGIISASQQISDLGFSSGSGLEIKDGYNIISQSNSTYDSNIILSGLYVDSNIDITFSQFSESLDSRFGAGGGSDYITNILFENNQLIFAGIGSAFNGTVPLSNGIISSSQQITNFGFVNNTYTESFALKNDISGSFTELSASIASDIAGIINGVSEATLGEITRSLLEGGSLDSLGNPINLISSSQQITNFGFVNNTYTSSFALKNDISGSFTQLSESIYLQFENVASLDSLNEVTHSLLYGGYVDANDNTISLVSGSQQITNFGFVNNTYTSSFALKNDISGSFTQLSASIASDIADIVGGIDYNFLINTPTFEAGDGIEILIADGNVVQISGSILPSTIQSINGTTGSLNTYTGSNNTALADIRLKYASTGSEGLGGNTFYGNQTVYGELETNTLSVVGVSNFQNIEVGGSSTFIGVVSNVVGELITTPPTASLDFSTGNFFQIQLDNTTATHISASNTTAGQVVTVLLQCGTNSTASFSSNILQPSDSFYTASQVGEVDIITFTTFGSNVYLTSVKNNFV
jgi:hypothetical protein